MSCHRLSRKPIGRMRRRSHLSRCCVRVKAAATRIVTNSATVTRRLATHGEYRRVIRGSFLAPWFAVSLGLVIAASLAVLEPPAVLSFPPSKGSPCTQSGCASPKPDPARNGALVIRAPAAAGSGRQRSPAVDRLSARRIPMQINRQVTGVEVSYRLTSENHGH